MAEHRVELVQLASRGRRSLPRIGAHRASRLRRSPPRLCGRNSCSGGSSRRMVTGRPAMISNSSTKSSRCIGSSLASAARRACLVVGQDHLAHGEDALVLEEHVLGAAQADALGAELARGCARRPACRRWRAPSSVRTSSAQPISVPKSPDSSGSMHRHRAGQHLAGRAVDGDDVALLEACCRRRVMRAARRSRRAIAPAPETQGLPMPRATTAACRSCRRAR